MLLFNWLKIISIKGEFLIAFWIKSKGSVEKKLAWLFELYDTDKSCYVSHSELVSMFTLIFNIKCINEDPFEKADYVFACVDINNDGRLSKPEFIEACLKDENLRKLLEA